MASPHLRFYLRVHIRQLESSVRMPIFQAAHTFSEGGGIALYNGRVLTRVKPVTPAMVSSISALSRRWR